MPDARPEFYETTSAVLLSFLWSHAELWEAGSDLLARAYIDIAGSLNAQASMEIGAHEATFSKRIKERYKDSVSAFAFEASPATFEHYRGDAELLGVKYINAAVSNKKGTLRFFEYRAKGDETPVGWSSLYRRNAAFKDTEEKREIYVKAITGDDFIRSQCPDKDNIALWIDVEGAQAEVLQGFSESFASKRISSVFIEVETSTLWPKQKLLASGVIARMGEFGFSPLARDINYGPLQFNIIFIRNDCLSDSVYALAESYIKKCRALLEAYTRQRRALEAGEPLPDNP